jgi:hypothetical protein
MSDNTYSFPAEVHVLKPRKISVSRKLDDFLEREGLVPSDEAQPEAEEPSRESAVRSNATNINAICCASCGQIEYLSRDFCRCGHFLRGQLEDEYLAWERGLHANHAALAESFERKMKPLRGLLLLAIPFLPVPMLQVLFWPDSLGVGSMAWFAPVVLIAGASAVLDAILRRPLTSSASILESYTFETFLEDRAAKQLH